MMSCVLKGDARVTELVVVTKGEMRFESVYEVGD